MDYQLESSVKVGKNVTIEPYAVVKGDSVLADNCVIGSFSVLINAKIGENTIVKSSRITDSTVGNYSTVGPNAHLRENSVVGDHCRIGNFVELKNSQLGDLTKACHLAYVGDATVGKNCNIGCGAIFVNYNGKVKNRTTVGDNVFIGSNCNLIAPLVIANDCFIACGTTVNKDLNFDDFAIGRPRVEVKPNRAHNYLK